jgi:hypothetical protein
VGAEGTPMTGSLIARQFEITHGVTHSSQGDFTHDESLVHPKPAGNCVNWVLGHIVATRNLAMEALGEPPIWTEDEARPYERGARTPLTADCAHRLEDIMAALDRSQAPLMARLGALGDADLGRTVDPAGPLDASSLGERLASLSFHESYHVGQFALLRRLLGKAAASA